MNKKISVYPVSLLIIYSLLALPLIYTHTLTLSNAMALMVYIFSVSYIGSVLLSYTSISNFLLPVSHTLLSLIIGGLCCSLFLFVNINAVFLAAMPVLLAVVLLFMCRKQTELKAAADKKSIIASAVAVFCIAMISSNEELLFLFSPVQYGLKSAIDSYYFTSVVASIRQGSIFNAAYEINTPINYQSLPFLIPSYLADLLNITSHQALWGLADPLYKFGALILCYDACHYFLKDKISGRQQFWLVPLAILLPLLLAPLHPLYILKGNIDHFIINSMGYVIPAGVITYPFSFIIFLLCLIVFSAADWMSPKITGDKVFFTVALAFLFTAKAFVFINALVFFGVIILKRIIADKEPIKNYLGYVISFLILTFLAFKLFMGYSQSGRTYFKYGYMADLVASWYGRSSTGLMNGAIAIGLIIATFALWIGIRFVGIYELKRSGNKKFGEFLLANAISLVVITVFASFLRYNNVLSTGEVVVNMDFNALGFIRGNFYIIGILSAIGFSYMVFKDGKKKVLIAIVGIGCVLSFASLVKRGLLTNIKLASHLQSAIHDTTDLEPWYVDNYKELKTGKYNDGLIAANPDFYTCGMLAASDYGHYWSSRSGTMYNAGNVHEYRWTLFKNMLLQPRDQYLVQMKNEGVKYIISTDVDYRKIEEISHLFPSRIVKVEGTKWIYQLK